MTLLELVSHLRRNILYDTGGTGVDWAAYSEVDADSVQLRWTNEELVANINEALTQVYRRIQPIKDTYTLNVKTGITTYTLPKYVKEIVGGRRADGKSIKERSVTFYEDTDSFLTQTGELETYIPDIQSGKLRVYPTPAVDETITFYVYRNPKTLLDWAYPDLSPELPEDYQIPMLYGAASFCYLKDEANTFDPNRSNVFTAMFDREFPFTSVYSSVRKNRTTNKATRYGGL